MKKIYINIILLLLWSESQFGPRQSWSWFKIEIQIVSNVLLRIKTDHSVWLVETCNFAYIFTDKQINRYTFLKIQFHC